MKVRELIEILSKEDPEKEVIVSYDTFACQYDLVSILEAYDTPNNKKNYFAPGIHLMAMNDSYVDYFLKERDRPIEGRAIARRKPDDV